YLVSWQPLRCGHGLVMQAGNPVLRIHATQTKGGLGDRGYVANIKRTHIDGHMQRVTLHHVCVAACRRRRLVGLVGLDLALALIDRPCRILAGHWITLGALVLARDNAFIDHQGFGATAAAGQDTGQPTHEYVPTTYALPPKRDASHARVRSGSSN